MASDTSPRGRETVTAFFETRADAEAALARLRRDGIAAEEARIYEGGPAAPDADRENRHKGFWETLGELFLPTEDRGAYAEGLSRGGTLLSIPVRSADRSRVLDILDAEGTVDFDEREADWRGEGWGGPATSPTFGDTGFGAAAGDTDLTAAPADAGLRSGISGIGAHAAGAPPAHLARRDQDGGRRRSRTYRMDDAPGLATDPVAGTIRGEIEIEDGRSPGSGERDASAAGGRGRFPRVP